MSTICFLCGKEGADTREHVIAKCLLPEVPPAGTNRLTVATHRSCNAEYAKDEEYLRDLVADYAAGFPDGKGLASKRSRSLVRDASAKYRKKLFKGSVPADIMTPSGLYVGKGQAVRGDGARIDSVGIKIARGVIFADKGAFVPTSSITCNRCRLAELVQIRQEGIEKRNPAWEVLVGPKSLLDKYGTGIAVQRCYIDQVSERDRTWLEAQAILTVGIYDQCFVLQARIEALDRAKRPEDVIDPT